jgi:Spy/CpxP family protein refolding chaperone
MNTPQRILLASLLMMGIASAACAAPAMPHRFAPGAGRRAHMAAVMQKLDLSPSQRARMREMHERQARRDIEARADLQTAQLDLRQMLRSDRPNRGEVDAQIDKVARLRADRQKEHIATMMEAREILTPEQREKLRDLRAGMGMRDGGGMRGGMGGPRGMRGRMHGMDGGGERGERGDAQ